MELNEILSFLQQNSAAIIAPINGLVAVTGFVVSAIYWLKFKKSKTPSVRVLALGISATAFGVALQRSYWAIGRAFEYLNLLPFEFFNQWSWITLFPLAIVVYGYSKHLQLAMEETFGKFSYSVFLGLLVALYGIIYFLLN